MTTTKALTVGREALRVSLYHNYSIDYIAGGEMYQVKGTSSFFLSSRHYVAQAHGGSDNRLGCVKTRPLALAEAVSYTHLTLPTILLV